MFQSKLTKEQILLVIIEAAVKKLELINKKLREQVYQYSVTGLYNRKFLLDKGNFFLKEEGYDTLAVLDVRNLRTFNEIFGYNTTDRILKHLSERLKEYCGKDCVLGNLDAGKFWILTKLGENKEKISIEKAKNLLKFLSSEELTLKEQGEPLSLPISVSIGIAFYPQHGKNIKELLMSAEIAVHKAKDFGEPHIQIFKPSYRLQIEENLKIEEILKKSINNGDIYKLLNPHFQLKIETENENIHGAEVLMRFSFTPNTYKVVLVAEKIGLIGKLFKVLVEKSLNTIKEAFKLNPQIHFAFNISPLQLKNLSELQETLEVLIKENLDLQKIELEITETQFLENPEVEELFTQLANKGFKLVIDDFGKGYSAFDRIKKWKISEVKIDRSLIIDLYRSFLREGENSRDYKFLKNLLVFLKNMGYKTTVEGVEDKPTVEILKRLKVDHIQGFYYSRPTEGKTFLECLSQWEKYRKCPFSGD